MSRVLVAVVALVLILAGALVFLIGRPPTATDEPRTSEAGAPAKHEGRPETSPVLEPSAPRAPVVATEEPASGAESAAGTGSSLRIRLLEKDSGLPLPRFRVRVASAGGSANGPVLESEDDGWLTLPSVTPGGAVDLELTENVPGPEDLVQTRKAEFRQALAGITHASVEVPADLHSFDLPVPCGPTFLLLFYAPRGESPTDFALRLRCADGRKAFDRALARVQTGGLPWARFGACATFLGGGPPWTLELSSDDGLWTGTAEIPSLESVRDPPIQIALVACGRLSGVVLTATREPVRKQWVRIVARGATLDSKDNRPRMIVTDIDGRFDAPLLLPGLYAIHIEADGQMPYDSTAQIEAGSAEEREIRLVASNVPRASLRVRVESATGRYSKPIAVALNPEGGGKSPPYGKVQWSDEGGRRVGRALLENVEVRDYRFSLSLPDFFPSSPKDTIVQPADQEIVCRIEDDTPTVNLRIRAVDEGSGKPVPGARVEVHVFRSGKPVGFRDSLESGECVFEDLPTNSVILVRIDGPDRAPAWATERDVVRGDKEWTIDARLHAGWGTEVMVRGTDGAAIEGARIYFDGTEVGTSDAGGRVLASLRSKPKRAEARYRDWVIAPSSALEADGTFREWERWLRVVLTPP